MGDWNPEAKKAYQRRYYLKNKERILQQAKDYYANNREHVKSRMRAYNKEHAEEITEKRRPYQQRYYAENREQILQRNAEWARNNRDKARALWKRYYARRWGGAKYSNVTAEHWAAIQKVYDYRCAYCGERPEKLTQDHVIPLFKGGQHVPENIVPACQSCNSSKSINEPPTLPAVRLML